MGCFAKYEVSDDWQEQGDDREAKGLSLSKWLRKGLEWVLWAWSS